MLPSREGPNSRVGEQCAGGIEHREVDAIQCTQAHAAFDEQPRFHQAFSGLFEAEVE